MKTVEEAEGKIGLKSIIYQKIPQEFSGEDKLFILRGKRMTLKCRFLRESVKGSVFRI